MRILAVIPHYFDALGQAGDGRAHGSVAKDPRPRAEALASCVAALFQHFDRTQSTIDIGRKVTRPINRPMVADVHVVVRTVGDKHLLGALPIDPSLIEHRPAEPDLDPMFLGFACREILGDALGQFDYYCYLEDDLIVRDPWFFAKLAWFHGHLGPEKLLMPNRFELARGGLVHKAYIDGDLADHVIARFRDIGDEPALRSKVLNRDVAFLRPANPHSGCYFLSADQMKTWSDRPDFLDRDTRFIGPLESAATLGVMRAFTIYKPAPENASFLEIEHSGTGFIGLIRT